MRNLFYTICLFLFFSVSNTFGQTVARVNHSVPIDSATRVRNIKHNITLLTKIINNTNVHTPLASVYALRGVSYFSLNEYEKAIKDFSSAVSLDPNLRDAYWNCGLSYERIRNYQAAINEYRKALHLVKNNAIQSATLNSNIAISQKILKQYDQAINSDSTAIAIDPMFTPSYENRGEVYLLTRKYQLAISDLSVAMNGRYEKRQLSIIVAERADAKRYLKQYKEAINDYSLAIEINPDNRVAYWNRAASYNQNGDYELANNDYSKAISYFKGDNKNLSRLYDDRARMEMGLQQYKKAILDDSLAISLDNQFGPAYWNKAQAYAQNADFQLSIDGYTKSMGFYQDNKLALAVLYDNIANEEYFLNDYQKVIDASTSSILLNEKLWSSHLNRGRAYLKKMNKDLAMDDFNKVLILDTTKRSFEYAFALFYTGNADKAITVMQDNLLSTTNNYVLMNHYYNLACLYSLMNKPDEANTYLKKCVDGGYPKRYALSDPDLDNIRNMQEFKNVIDNKTSN